nr:AraC family transcriptional regulator [Clostridia bacterium]
MYYEILEARYNYFSFGKTVNFPMHYHGSIELIYVTKGEIEVIIDGTSNIIGEGGLALAFPYQAHEYRSEGIERFAIIALPEFFPTLEQTFHTCMPNSPVYTYSGEDRRILESMIDVMRIVENKHPSESIKTIDGLYCKSQLSAILAFHLDHVGTTQMKPLPDMPIIKQAMRMIEENYLDPEIDIEHIAKEIGVTRQHMSNVIRKHTGSTVLDLLHNMRISHARVMLLKTIMPVSEVALNCGFSSIRTFNRVF